MSCVTNGSLRSVLFPNSWGLPRRPPLPSVSFHFCCGREHTLCRLPFPSGAACVGSVGPRCTGSSCTGRARPPLCPWSALHASRPRLFSLCVRPLPLASPPWVSGVRLPPGGTPPSGPGRYSGSSTSSRA